ncbi:MAG: VCBS repeat-containing protein, partial [Bacteroidetes bacterium]
MKANKICLFAWVALLLPGWSCQQQAAGGGKLFTRMEASHTGIDFENKLTNDRKFNIYTYRNFYNGGGVGMGDFNGDSLIDVYLTANMLPNRLFLNRGDFRFTDVTEQAGVSGTRAWSTGVSVADVNGDGLLDIYVCNSGDVEGDNKQNELFINQGTLPDSDVPVFKEAAEQYGLADRGFS